MNGLIYKAIKLAYPQAYKFYRSIYNDRKDQFLCCLVPPYRPTIKDFKHPSVPRSYYDAKDRLERLLLDNKDTDLVYMYLTPLNKRIGQLERRLEFLKTAGRSPDEPGRSSPGQRPVAVDIETIKESVLIEDIMPDNPVIKGGKQSKYRCPFPGHDDKNPSFVLYHENNSCYCFSCSRGGSNIDFLKHMYGYTTGEAIKELTKYLK